LDPTAKYVLVQDIAFRMVARDQVQVRAFGDSVTLPLAWYLILLKFARPSTVHEACAAYGVALRKRPEIRRALARLQRAGILQREGAAAENVCIRDLLEHEVFAKPSSRSQVRAALSAGRLVVIPNAFRKRVAEALHRELVGTTAWRPQTEFSQGFFYRHHNLYDPWAWPPALRRMQGVFASPATRAFIADLAQQDCSALPALSASRYLPGDHSLPHDDSDGRRSVAFVWHLTKTWDPTWGGAFYWARSDFSLMPGFNTLLLFVVSETSTHFVTTVSPHARGERLAVNGWWRRAALEKMPSTRRPSRKDAPSLRICGGRVIVH